MSSVRLENFCGVAVGTKLQRGFRILLWNTTFTDKIHLTVDVFADGDFTNISYFFSGSVPCGVPRCHIRRIYAELLNPATLND